MPADRIVDADVAAWLDALARVESPPFASLSAADVRAAYDAAPKPPGDPLPHVVDRTISGPAGPIPVRAYARAVPTNWPVVAFFHGGGFVLSGLDGHDSLCRRLASQLDALVVSVGYRLAPEHPFPAGHDDCWAVTAWLADHASDLGGDGDRLAVCGDSAGGSLAATVAIHARDDGLRLRLQALVYPNVDCGATYGSYTENGTGLFLRADDLTWFWDQYVAAAHRANPYAVPMRSTDLTGVAPALVQTADLDPLRDEGEAYAARLRDCGVPVTLTCYPGVVHGFVSRWTTMARAHDAHRELTASLAAALAS